MSTVPLDLQRRCERRWAARHQRPQEPAATPKHRPEKQDQRLAAPAQGQNKKPPGSTDGFEVVPAA